MQETVKNHGDAVQLRYIRNRYNYLLTLKEGLEAAITHACYVDSNLKFLADIQKELITLDDKRTQFVNRKNIQVAISNISPVFSICQTPEKPERTPLDIIKMKIKTNGRLNRWEYQTAVAHGLIKSTQVYLTDKELADIKANPNNIPTRVQMKIKRTLKLNSQQFTEAKKKGLLIVAGIET